MTTTARADAFAGIRNAEFAALDDAIYLNAASFGPLPERTRSAMDEFSRLRQAAHEFARFDVDAPLHRCRAAAARVIGASPAEVALAPNTSYGLYLAARLIGQFCSARARDVERPRIVVSDREFPANVLPWLGLERSGALVDVVPTDERGLPRHDALCSSLEHEDVVVFALSAVQFASGYRADLEHFGRVCRERDILFVVDAIQAAGMIPLDVRAAQADIVACGGQKWLCGPFGSGFTYVRRELCEELRPELAGWLSTSASQDFSNLLDYHASLLADARRFETGSLGVQDYVGLSRSIELILELGMDRVWQRIRSLQAPLLDWAAAHPDAEPLLHEDPERRSGILCVRVPGAAGVHARLTEQGVICVVREGALRFSPHFYNTDDEIARVVDILDQVL